MKIWTRCEKLCGKIKEAHPEIPYTDLLWAGKRMMPQIIAKQWETPETELAIIELARRRPGTPESRAAERAELERGWAEDRARRARGEYDEDEPLLTPG